MLVNRPEVNVSMVAETMRRSTIEVSERIIVAAKNTAKTRSVVSGNGRNTRDENRKRMPNVRRISKGIAGAAGSRDI